MKYFSKMRSAVLALALVGASFVPAAHAQDADDPKALAIAKDILEVSRVTNGFNNILPEMAERTKQTFIRTSPGLALVITEVTDTVALGLISERVKLQEKAARIWTSRFTTGELEDILDFYNTDAGKKFALNYPLILRDTVNLTNEWGEELAQTIAAKVRVEMALRGHKL